LIELTGLRAGNHGEDGIEDLVVVLVAAEAVPKILTEEPDGL
jgi:hypothetical protein